MRKLAAWAVTIGLGLMMIGDSSAQEGGPPALYRIGLSEEDIFLEPDPNITGRYTLFWGGWITVDSRTPEPIKLTGECSLTPLGMWTMASTSRFGTARLVPGINSLYQKFPLASIDLPREVGSYSPTPSFSSLFDYTQVVKLRLSIMRRDHWIGAPALVTQKYQLRPLGYALLKAASTGDAGMVRELLDKGADADSATVENWTALMEAASNGSREVVKLLLDYGAKVNERRRGFPFVVTELGARFPYGHTALMAACSSGDMETVRLLLDAGAKVNFERSPDRWSALMAASYGGHTEIVKMLLDKGASVTTVDEWGYSPTALAAINGSGATVRFLKAGGDEVRTPWNVLTRH
jgi:hypothetical protein